MFPSAWQEHMIRERRLYEYQRLGASFDDIQCFESLITQIAQRTTLPNHIVIDEGWIMGKRRLTQGRTLLPPVAEHEVWVRTFVQSMLLGNVLSLADPVGVYTFIEVAKSVLTEREGQGYE